MHALGLRPEPPVDPKEKQAEAQARTFDLVCARLKITSAQLPSADPALVCQAISDVGKPPPASEALPPLVAEYVKRRTQRR